MLQLRNIKKSYTTAGFTQHALDGVSVAFRDNEFAAVLGPSGSGKTTMLNVIGGLDRYDSGDLEIDGISTKKYKDSDWDTYRNNRIGFVFQSYNLIPHQNVLANVELALTLGGVSKAERRRRAKMALDEVGLGAHIRKKPGQLSGGQMQRVAIARALVNDPEILLADEPTGALDSKTGLQVMELLTKIAEDRLVIMVTHNNELAEQYANRLIHLTDGKVTADSHPFDPSVERQRRAAPPRRSRMSFMTAISLSFSNLMTKKGRTFTTAFAGSIGIIGIATILAFSNGINEYIRGIEEDTLSLYPLTIEQQSFDFSAFFGGSNDDSDATPRPGRRERPEGTVREVQVMETIFSTQNINDLGSLKAYIEENEPDIKPHVNAIQYTYDITPQIYLADTSGGIDRINPDAMFTAAMGTSEMPSIGGIGPGAMMNVFYSLPTEENLYISQYEVLAGRWPRGYDEAVLVLPFNNGILDFMLFSIGIRDRAEMRAMFESVMQGSEADIDFSESEFFYSYETLMNAGFKVVNLADTFQYDETFEIWVDKSGDEEFMRELLARSPDLKIVGIMQPHEEASTTVLQPGVNYTPELIYHLIDRAVQSPIVREQLENPDVNVITGNTFEYERENPSTEFDFSRIMSVDEDAIRDAMDFGSMADAFDFDGIDLSGLDFGGLDMGSFDMSGMDFSNIDMGSLDFSNIDMSAVPPPQFDLGELAQAIATQVNIPPEAINGIMQTLMSGIVSEVIMANPALLADPDAMAAAITEYLSRPETMQMIMAELSQYTDPATIQAQLEAALTGFIMTAMQEYMTAMMGAIQGQIEAAMQAVMGQITGQIQGAMSQMATQMQRAMAGMADGIEAAITEIFEDMAAQMEDAMDAFDGDALADAFRIELSEEAVFELMSAMMNPRTTSYDQNLHLLGYADMENPTQITIYPVSFESKEAVLTFLDNYNAEMERAGQPERVVHFTDIVGIMMSSVTDIVDVVSYALIAFVSVALVVSSIMIGVITFVSVLERKKEIGILRAVGASKSNIKLVFNAETLIIGFVAGVMGMIVTSFIIIIANAILLGLVNMSNLVIMPPAVPFIMVGISMFLTYVAGLIPAASAARKPPVEALRSE